MRRKPPIAFMVFAPFVCGYYISYVFRTINSVIASQLTSDLGLNAANIGILTSAYFLTFALAQLPLGVLLDRYGPRRVQGVLLLLAACGAALFGFGHSFAVLVLSRALIGLGVSGALIAGLKAIVLWFPPNKLSIANGWFIMLGALGAVTATGPVEILLAWAGWRDLFKLLAIVTTLCALAIYFVVPEHPKDSVSAVPSKLATLRSIYCNPRFWRLAPLSTSCIGTAWALQGYWAAAWLTDVEKLNQVEIVQYLFVMAVALSVGAVVLGAAANTLRRYGIAPRGLLAMAAILFISVQLSLVARIAVPLYFIFIVIGCVGAATVLSYTALAESFPGEHIGQANTALNVLHIGGGFAVQCFIGIIVQQWMNQGGHYPPIAYQTAFGLIIVPQCIALLWLIFPTSKIQKSLLLHITQLGASGTSRGSATELSSYDKAAVAWEERLRAARVQVASWSWAALGSFTVTSLLGLTFASRTSQSGMIPYTITVEHLGSALIADYSKQIYRPSDALVAYFIAQFVDDVRSISIDPIVVYAKWRRAYYYLTDRAARTLNDYARLTDAFSKIGIITVEVDVVSVVRTSESSFEVRWNESTYEKEALSRTEQFTAAIALIFKTSDVPEMLRENPLGLYIHGLSWSRDFGYRDDSH